MPVNGIKDNKCFESAIWMRGTWDFSVSAGDTETQAFSLTGSYPDNPVVVVTANDENYDPSEVLIYGYIDELASNVVIGVKNNGSSALNNFNVNFVVI